MIFVDGDDANVHNDTVALSVLEWNDIIDNKNQRTGPKRFRARLKMEEAQSPI